MVVEAIFSQNLRLSLEQLRMSIGLPIGCSIDTSVYSLCLTLTEKTGHTLYTMSERTLAKSLSNQHHHSKALKRATTHAP
ncbi:unnamed protein product [Gordionus sp. m RMFG-2023]